MLTDPSRSFNYNKFLVHILCLSTLFKIGYQTTTIKKNDSGYNLLFIVYIIIRRKWWTNIWTS
jgi:hypothetical protein